MKKIVSLLSISLLLGNSLAISTWDDVIDNEEQKVENEKVKVLNEKFKLEKFTTQDEFENILVEKMYDKVLDSCNYRIYPVPMYKTMDMDVGIDRNIAVATESVALDSAVMEKRSSSVSGNDKVSY
jgi:hypothetical protein